MYVNLVLDDAVKRKDWTVVDYALSKWGRYKDFELVIRSMAKYGYEEDDFLTDSLLNAILSKPEGSERDLFIRLVWERVPGTKPSVKEFLVSLYTPEKKLRRIASMPPDNMRRFEALHLLVTSETSDIYWYRYRHLELKRLFYPLVVDV